jgi:hypothetical protein
VKLDRLDRLFIALGLLTGALMAWAGFLGGLLENKSAFVERYFWDVVGIGAGLGLIIAAAMFYCVRRLVSFDRD